MRQWANAAIRKEDKGKLLLPPVQASFTKYHGKMLLTRLLFLENYLNEYYQEDLSEENHM